jgi:hypothetical protein
MTDTHTRLFEEKLKNRCCSMALMALCLDDFGEENEPLIKAMGALCDGMGEGQVCGTLAAAVCALFMSADDMMQANRELRPEMMNWFFSRFGAFTCEEILDGNEMRRISECPIIVEETYEKLREMLEDIGAF